ncbi:hypothetical protein [uncultured Campylobacter sp.]|uniref:hypothetical protein n=1 Tax=uncultured Campylobacter sp. TaxID=218934 RepID=UPI00261CA5D7|nr:hypothetical protein [uncultured Campylobacter sp.]
MKLWSGCAAEFCAVLPHKRSWLYGFAVRLEYSAPKFYRILVKDRFIKFCKFYG